MNRPIDLRIVANFFFIDIFILMGKKCPHQIVLSKVRLLYNAGKISAVLRMLLFEQIRAMYSSDVPLPPSL